MQRSIAIIYTDNRVKNRNCNRLKFNAPGTIDQEISQRMEKKKEKERRTRWNEIGIRETRITVLK